MSRSASASRRLQLEGCNHFRWRLVFSVLSGKSITIKSIRSKPVGSAAVHDFHTGLTAYEASFLRLVDKLTNGTVIDINETGTSVSMVPGMIIGGDITHDCPVSASGGGARSVGWYIEGLLPLLPFAKSACNITFTGITNDDMDMTVDYIRLVALPLLAAFGCSEGWDCQIQKRGAPPLGGGSVSLRSSPLRSLSPVNLTEEGLVRKVRGVAYAAKVSPQFANRMIEASRPLLLELLPDVHIYADAYKGAQSGNSPGYGVLLTAHTTSGCVLSAQRSSKDAATVDDPRTNMPETLGEDASTMLLNEIARGGCVDTNMQPLLFAFMALCPEDVSRVRIGQLGPGGMAILRLLKDFFGIVFKLTPQTGTAVAGKKRSRAEISGATAEETASAKPDIIDPATGRKLTAEVGDAVSATSILVSCLGIGYSNVSKRVS